MRRWLIPCLLLPVLPVFWLYPAEGQTPATPAAAIAVPKRTAVVVAANGAGGDAAMSANLGEIIAARCLPIAVHQICWCRYEMPKRDYLDEDAQIAGARRMANYVKNYRSAFPNEKIYLLGHSSGCNVILHAVERLPPGSVDRIVLLAPSVSWTFNLGQALRCSCAGVDVMISPMDQVLYTAASEFGTSDHKWVSAAGEVGFGMLPPTHPDAALYRNLRQYRWCPQQPWIGHCGNHIDYTCLVFVAAHVLPFFLAP